MADKQLRDLCERCVGLTREIMNTRTDKRTTHALQSITDKHCTEHCTVHCTVQAGIYLAHYDSLNFANSNRDLPFGIVIVRYRKGPQSQKVTTSKRSLKSSRGIRVMVKYAILNESSLTRLRCRLCDENVLQWWTLGMVNFCDKTPESLAQHCHRDCTMFHHAR